MKYKAVMFDLDGTLVHTDSECIYYMASRAFSDLGETLSKNEIDKFWFDHKREDFIKEKGLDIKSFWKTYKKYDTLELRKQYLKPYKDTDFIHELKKRGYKLGIVTGAPRHIIALSTEILGKENFDAIVRAQLTSGIKPKPDPQGIEECLKIMKIKNYDSVFVGNGDEDTLAARAAAVEDVLILRDEHNLIEIEPSFTISSLYGLRDVVHI
ncbi:MAG: HAD family hydrolase [Candidatus Aenigmarchaeota archaeon]|nr:HAD family hydrolase [Candidatus Aenigmarchaeota archaeon]